MPVMVARICSIKGPFIATQLNSTSSWVELRRYKRAFNTAYTVLKARL